MGTQGLEPLFTPCTEFVVCIRENSPASADSFRSSMRRPSAGNKLHTGGGATKYEKGSCATPARDIRDGEEVVRRHGGKDDGARDDAQPGVEDGDGGKLGS